MKPNSAITPLILALALARSVRPETLRDTAEMLRPLRNSVLSPEDTGRLAALIRSWERLSGQPVSPTELTDLAVRYVQTGWRMWLREPREVDEHLSDAHGRSPVFVQAPRSFLHALAMLDSENALENPQPLTETLEHITPPGTAGRYTFTVVPAGDRLASVEATMELGLPYVPSAITLIREETVPGGFAPVIGGIIKASTTQLVSVGGFPMPDDALEGVRLKYHFMPSITAQEVQDQVDMLTSIRRAHRRPFSLAGLMRNAVREGTRMRTLITLGLDH